MVGLLDGFIRMVEAPWSPEQSFLPERRTPELSGNSPEAFRQLAKCYSVDRLESIRLSENHIRLSHWSQLYEFSIPAPIHSPEISGGKILHLSDVHFLLGSPRPIFEVQNLTHFLRSRDIVPDAIVLTGDVITKMPDDLCPAALRSLAELAEISPRSFFVHGNHDYHGKVPQYIAGQLGKVGFENITGEISECRLGRGYASLYGVDDSYFGSPRAPDSVVDACFNITLVHNLDAIRKNFPSQMDLILSGHTHWGEVSLPFSKQLSVLDGMWWMNKWGYADNINHHTRHWDQLNNRTLSFVHPGLARYYAPRVFAYAPGFVLMNFHSASKEQAGRLEFSGLTNSRELQVA